MGKPKAPAAPDYKGAAEATAAGDLEAARLSTLANRPDVYTPGGSQTWQQDGDKWTQTQTLSPEAQLAYESGERLQTGLAGLGEQAVGQVQGLFGDRYQGPSDPMETFGQNRQNVMDAMMSRVGTDIGRDRETTSANLIAQGIPVGSEAYNRQMEQLDRKQTDARQQAEIQATSQALAEQQGGMDVRRQGIQEALLERQTPLNEISAFRTGSQVQQPQFQAYGQMPFTGGADYMGAAGAQGQYDMGAYNADVASKNAMMGGLFDIGGAAIGKWG